MQWAYGVTTVGERLNTTLPRTLNSLEQAGFPDPHLFVDGADDIPEELRKYQYTTYCPNLRTFGNWMITAWSLYIRNPHADRYAIFQDDFITYKNLREFLERSWIPGKGYANMYTFPSNERGRGWHMSNQRGLGAVALAFEADVFRSLISHKHMLDRPMDDKRGHRAVDGGIVTAIKKLGWFEFVHSPTLTQHIGKESSMGNKRQPNAVSFRGDKFDALDLL